MDVKTDLIAWQGEATGSPLIESAELRCILSNLSQELCRPLESLRAGFDLLLVDDAKRFSGDQKGHVRTMSELCDDMLRLTRDYLDYAGLVHGTLPLNIGTFTLGALIREIDRRFAPLASAQGISWECVVDSSDAAVATDASRCQQILGNLATNALNYSGDGGLVRLSARHAGDHWTVTVADQGPGIPDEHLSHVFEPFFRLPRDERSGVEGNGLGLAICREMVNQLGGTIELAARADGGTEAKVSFPLAPTDVPHAASQN